MLSALAWESISEAVFRVCMVVAVYFLARALRVLSCRIAWLSAQMRTVLRQNARRERLMRRSLGPEQAQFKDAWRQVFGEHRVGSATYRAMSERLYP